MFKSHSLRCLAHTFAFCALGILLSSSALAGPTLPYRLLKDINPGSPSGFQTTVSVDPFISTGSLLFFLAEEPSTGKEMWRTDGTTDGTFLVADLEPGSAGSSPFIRNAVLSVGGLLFFRFDDGVNGAELWKSDGTGGGTFMITDIFPGVAGNGSPQGSFPGEFVNYQGLLHFRARRFVDVPRRGIGTETAIWRSDGTAGGTQPVYVAADSNSSNIGNLAAVGNRIYFSDVGGLSSPDNHGLEPFVSDGTQDGTFEIVDLYPGTTSSSPSEFTDVNGIAYFRALDATAAPNSRFTYFRTDGTAIGTWRIAPTSAEVAFGPQRLVGVGSTAYFDWFNGPMGGGLWKSEGAPDSAVQVKDLDPTRGDELIEELTPVGDRVIFLFDDGVHGKEWWTSDGTEVGTTLLVDSVPGPGGGQARGNQRTMIDGLFYFTTSSGVVNNPSTIWRTDGTPEGTAPYIDLPGITAIFHMEALGTTLIFAGIDGNLNTGIEPFAIDLLDLVPTPAENPFPANGSTVIGTDFSLSWDSVPFATSYDVFLWEASGTKPGTPTESGLTSPNYDPPSLTIGTVYQWEVVANGDNGSATSPTWLFTPIKLSSAILDALVNTRTLTPEERDMADANGDGRIDIADFVFALNQE